MDGVFANEEQIERGWREHRARSLRVFLSGLAEETRDALLREMRGTLREDHADVLREFGWE